MVPVPDISTWFLVFARVGAMLSIFPIFSSTHFPVQIRVALAALVGFLITAMLPVTHPVPLSWWGLVGAITLEVLVGLMLGFIGRLVFYAMDTAGTVMATEMGLMMSSDVDPFTNNRTETVGIILNYLAIMIFLSTDMVHWFIVAMQRSYAMVPIGGAGLSEALLLDVVKRTGEVFVIAVQLSAPLIATAFIISLVFSVLGRAVPQMNVFSEHFAFRTMAGLMVFGLTLNLSAQYITNYLHKLPEDMLQVAKLMGAG